MTKDETLKLALEALKLSAVTVDNFNVQKIVNKAITAIKEALAQSEPNAQVAAVKTLERLRYTYHGAELWKPPLGKAQPEQEPVACGYDVTTGICISNTCCHTSATEPVDCYAITPEHEAIATKNKDGITLHFAWDKLHDGAKLYTSPPQRKPLTVHEIAEFVGTHQYNEDNLLWFRLGEAAHGIKGDA